MNQAIDNERRSENRRRLLKSVTLSPDGLNTVFDGVLRNTSPNGARVKVADPYSIPSRILVHAREEQINKWASVVWRANKEVGLHYLDI